jgi:hypothetical protein
MPLPPAYLSQKLTQPLPTKDVGVLRTIGDAVTYMLALPPDRGELCQRRRHATKLHGLRWSGRGTVEGRAAREPPARAARSTCEGWLRPSRADLGSPGCSNLLMVRATVEGQKPLRRAFPLGAQADPLDYPKNTLPLLPFSSATIANGPCPSIGSASQAPKATPPKRGCWNAPMTRRLSPRLHRLAAGREAELWRTDRYIGRFLAAHTEI